MKPWERDDTKLWIAQLENRIEDLQFYLSRALEWCKDNEVYSDRVIFVCSMMTMVWVSHLRNEPISKHELFEILGVANWESVDDAVFGFNPEYESMELEELLETIVRSFY